MSKETISLEILQEIVPLYNEVKKVYDECSNKTCSTCEFRKSGTNCQAMYVAVKLQNKLRNSIIIKLRTFVNYSVEKFYDDDSTVFDQNKVIQILKQSVNKFIEEEL